jgi:hypothetical protein
MRDGLAVGESGARSGIPHPSARGLSSPRPTNNYHATNGKPCSARPLSPVAKWSPITNHKSLLTVHRPALSAVEGSQITAFLIDTLPIRNVSNSFLLNKCAHSNRHSSETHFGASKSLSTHLHTTGLAKSCREHTANGRNLISSTSSTSSTSSASSPSRFHFALQTTGLQYPCVSANLICYSFVVTRVPPNGLRASAPARSHGCGVDVSLPRNVRTTGAFPHKFTYSTGLMGPASHILRDWPRSPFGFRSPESPVGHAGVKENSCES